MNSILNNPYRIAGILANASAREIHSRKGKIAAYAKVGREITSEYDFPFLVSLSRNSSIIDKAFSDIEQNQNKITHSLFWFLNLNSIDGAAIQHLTNGDKQKATEIWEKLTENKEVSAKNFSAFNNLGTLYLLDNSKEAIKRGITLKTKLIQSDYFQDFVHTVADETFSIDAKKQTELLIDELLLQFKNKFLTADIPILFGYCNENVQKYLSQKLTEEPTHKIETQIEQTKNKRINNKRNAYNFGVELHRNTQNVLAFLKAILGVEDLKYKMLADNVAKEILQCSIDYFNESQAQDVGTDYLSDAMKLVRLALQTATSKIVKQRIEENISTLEGMKDRELSEVIMFLKSVKKAYAENERKIRQEVERMKKTDILLKLGHKTINWSAVEESIKNSINWGNWSAVEESIKNSINWGNVNDLLSEVLTEKNLKKIKESDKTEVKKEFLELIHWTKNNSLKSSIISRIIEKYKNIPPKLPFEILSAEITNTDSKSRPIKKTFHIEDIRYIGLKLKVRSTGTQTITIYSKYINPEGKYSNNSKSSLGGYTMANDITVTPLSDTINLGGWGNAEKCTYMVGAHKIEVYVEHYKIFTKTFQVDWSPNKKAELIRNSELLQYELREVQKFKWFRTSITKEKEVKAVIEKIKKIKETLMNK